MRSRDLVMLSAVSITLCVQGCNANGGTEPAVGAASAGGNAGGGQQGAGGAGGLIGVGGDTAGGEICGNGLDDDGDGSPDQGCPCVAGASQQCFVGDPSLAGKGACSHGTQTCVATTSGEFGSAAWGACTGSGAAAPEACSNGVDDDCDGLVDCADSDCNCDGKQEDCGDGQDNDGDGAVDCQDSDCAAHPNCPTTEVCDGKDNDFDGKVDEGDVCRDWQGPCPPNAVRACDCYCGVHQRCLPNGTWGPCKVDGSCQLATETVTSCQAKGMTCDFGNCVPGFGNGSQCVHHKDCPIGQVCDLGQCIFDPYFPCP